MALALDGSASSGSTSVTLTTTNANDVIILAAVINADTVHSVSDTAGLTWAKRASVGGANDLEVWWAIASSALTSDVITVSSPLNTFIELHAFGVSGANTASPFDTNGSLPATATSGAVSVSTTAANTFIYGAGRFSNASANATSPFTTIVGAGNFTLTEYDIVSSAQSSLTVSNDSQANCNGAIGDAIVAAGGYVPYNPWPQAAPILAQ